MGGFEDYCWLVSEHADRWLKIAAEQGDAAVNSVQSLRRELGASRAHLVLEQASLRRRARDKFALAEQMFFTRKGYEQATDNRIALYKSQRFTGRTVTDFCCGIGGDLQGLAARGATTGIDRDEVCQLFAAANVRLVSDHADVLRCDVCQVQLQPDDAWHMDHDRRTDGRRVTHLNFLVPGPTEIEQVSSQCCHGAVKLAPATVVPDAWTDRAELEWIGNRRECRQLVAWFGGLARHPGGRCATVLDRKGDGAETLFGSPDAKCDVATRISRFIYDPHRAVRAARLTGALADQFGMLSLSAGEGYLTADRPSQSRLFASFEVMEELPFDLRRVKAMLRRRSIGQLEIKQRGVRHDPQEMSRALQPRGDNKATLLISNRSSGVIAILARRCYQEDPA